MSKRVHPKTRAMTVSMAAVSAVSTGLLLLLWVPVMWSADLDHSFRPMSLMWPTLILLTIGTIPAALVGCGQLFCQPRIYGLITLAASAVPFAAFKVANWLLLDLRGIPWE
jgi:hypothetical protein